MNSFWIIFSSTTFSFGLISFLLYLRSNYRCIASRSPILLQITHWANYFEILGTLLIIYSEPLKIPSSDLMNWVLKSLLNLSNCTMIFAYLIRAYRLFLVFNMEKSKDSENPPSIENHYKLSQRWALTLLISLIFSVFLVSLSIFLYILISRSDFGLFTRGERSNNLAMVDNLIIFLLQLFMILMISKISHVTNEYQMLKEMITATILLFFTPFFSLFVRFFQKTWLFSYVVRNLLLMFVSSLTPVVMSFFQKDAFGIVTVDMLMSLELVLQHKFCYDYFERFLRRVDAGKGVIFLDLYISCQCYFYNHDKRTEDFILRKVKNNTSVLQSELFEECSNKLEKIWNIFNHCKEVLENEYFESFKTSKHFKSLKGFLYRQELLNNRISQTSLLPSNPQKQRLISLMTVFSDD